MANEQESPEERFNETRKKAEQGDRESQFNLGQMYRKGEGVPHDDEEAFTWYCKAAHQGHGMAPHLINAIHPCLRDILIDFWLMENDVEAAKWFRREAEQGDALAQYALGQMYREGKGVSKNDEKAAEQGNADAQFNLGVMYNFGEGVPEDFVEAAKWIRKAAEQGHALAQYNLGLMYNFGEGVPKDDVEAYAWFLFAKQKKKGRGLSSEVIPRLEERISRLERELTAEQIEKWQARSAELHRLYGEKVEEE